MCTLAHVLVLALQMAEEAFYWNHILADRRYWKWNRFTAF